MATMQENTRSELLYRRQRVEAVLAAHAAPQFQELLNEIDLALERFEAGRYGLCEECGDPIEPDRLDADPLARLCLDHLTPSQARELEQDLDLAARVQRQLLPPRHVAAHGWDIAYHYEPLGAVSGDYCDVVHPSGADADPVFLFGDISGKGVAASMLMAHLHASVRTLVGLDLPVSQVVERANRVFCDSTMANHYATLVCGRLTRSGEVEICNAGHCAPLLAQDGHVTAVEATGVPIGLFCVSEFQATRHRMAHGDTLVLYTDGLTEACNVTGDEFGEGRLTALVAAHDSSTPDELISVIARHVAAFRGAVPRADDVTIMVIRRKSDRGEGER